MADAVTNQPAWHRLDGGPCDGEIVWVDPTCVHVVITRDTDRQPWFRHVVAADDHPVLMATEAGLYSRGDPETDFTYNPRGLERYFERNQAVWHIPPT